jgi:DUF971 family protein/molybdopterin converting factor small subunit
MMSLDEESVPTNISLHQHSRILEISFEDGARFQLPCEYLRVFSPAAEVRVLESQGQVVKGKEEVNISRIEPVGHYAVRLVFDDGHDTGVYSWKTLYALGRDYDANWHRYLQTLKEQGYRRYLPGGESDSGQPVRVKLLFFAWLVDRFERETEELTLPGPRPDVRSLLATLRNRGGEWQRNLREDAVQVTINKQFAGLEAKLVDRDEIAIVPIRRM